MPRDNIVIIGSSTGGPKILEELLPDLPVLKASVIIIQHITPTIDQSLAASLARSSSMPVCLAQDGQLLQQGQVYLAPGGVHLSLVNNSRIHLFQGERVNSVCPSIDVTMKSVLAPTVGRVAGIILTGMGRDGADGICHLKAIGAVTIAQDRKTSVIYGMPRSAADTGKIDFILSTTGIGRKLGELFT